MAWSYEQLFNSLNTGDLNGQDSWSGDPNYDVGTTAPFEGTKGVQSTASNGTIRRAITAVSSGVMYFAMRRPDTISDAEFQLRTAGNTLVRLQIAFQGGNITVSDSASPHTLVTNYSTSVFYVFEVTFDASNQHSIRYRTTATAWSASTGNLAAENNGDIDAVGFSQGSLGTAYIDTITPTDPTPSSISGSTASLMGVG